MSSSTSGHEQDPTKKFTIRAKSTLLLPTSFTNLDITTRIVCGSGGGFPQGLSRRDIQDSHASGIFDDTEYNYGPSDNPGDANYVYRSLSRNNLPFKKELE